MSRLLPILMLAAVPALAPSLARAHAVLQDTSASQNSVYKGVVAIDHGCKGAPTTAIHITIPEGFVAAKPMPKAGWTLTIDKGPYAKSYAFKGGLLASGARTLTWTGNLPDEDYDEFVFEGFITSAVPGGSTLYFPVVQDCAGDTAYHWTETPTSSVEAAPLAHPAPGVSIMASAAVPSSVALIDHLRVSQSWTRATPEGATQADAFVTISNRGAASDRLTKVTTDVADTVMLGRAPDDEQQGSAEPLAGLEIAPGKSLHMGPTGLHLILSGLKHPLKQGDLIQVTLTFDRAGALQVPFYVGSSDALTSGSIMPSEDAPDRL